MKKSYQIASALVVAVASLPLAGCQSSTSGGASGACDGRITSDDKSKWPERTVDLGGGQSVHFEAGEPLRLVEFNFGPGYVFTDAIKAGATAKAEELGVELDILDASDPTKQLQQMQDAMQSCKYNGAIVTAIVSELVCNVLTKQMPARDMMGVLTNVPTCGRGQKSGEEALSPGQLAQVGGQQFLSTVQTWADEIAKRNPGPQKTIVVVGPDGNQQSENAITSLENIEKDNPDFEVVAKVHTDYSTADALKKVQDALQAHPDATIIATSYSELTKGSVTALRQAGKLGAVKIYDIGADSTVIPLIENGDVDMTYPLYPKSMGSTAVQALYDARMGNLETRVFENDGHPAEEMRPAGAPVLFIDRKNVAEWNSSGLAEY